MKFILGYIPGSLSKTHAGPKVFWEVSAEHNGKMYKFERLVRGPGGIHLPELRVYESSDYPDSMINALLANHQIVELMVKASCVASAGK